MKITQRKLKKNQNFYKSEWYGLLRRHIFGSYRRRCMRCESKRELVVDHIKPRSAFPELELNPDNLQILCNDCNVNKSNLYIEDFRTPDDKEKFANNLQHSHILKSYKYLYEYESNKKIPDSEKEIRIKLIRELIHRIIRKDNLRKKVKFENVGFKKKKKIIRRIKKIDKNPKIIPSVAIQLKDIAKILD